MGSLYKISVNMFLIVLSVCACVVVSLDTEPHQHRHSRSSATRFSHLDRLLNRLDKTYPSPSSSSSSPSPTTSSGVGVLRNHRLRGSGSTAQSFADFDDEHRISTTREQDESSDNKHNDDDDDDTSFHNSLWDEDEINNGFTDSARTTPAAVGTAEELDRRWSRILEMAKNKKPTVRSSGGDGGGARKQEEDVVVDENDEEEEDEEEEDEEDDEEEDDNEDDETLVKNTQADTYDRRPHWAPRQTDYSSWKWENLGNQQSVDRMFQVFRSGLLRPESQNRDDMTQEVYKHNKLVSRETQCRVPRPKVIRVSDVYPSTSKLYVPACTVLHQCGDDTGCCSGTGQRCGPKYTKRVELYFYTTYIVSSHSRQRTSASLEKLPFYNHTECECQDRMEDLMPRDSDQEYRRSDSRTSEPSCKCPSEYTVRHLANGSCSCDCFDKQRDCIKYKKGKEYFNHQDRLCIEMGTCQLPSCDFGVYLRRSGRCPRKHEKFRSWSAYH